MEVNIGTKKNPVLFKFQDFKGKRLLDIRKYFINKDTQELVPTKKGVLLNVMQFNNLVEKINDNSNQISSYFTESDKLLNKNVKVSFEALIGRNFNIETAGGQTNIKLSNTYKNKLNDTQKELFCNMILPMHQTLLEMFDDENEIDFFLDVFDKKLANIL